MASQIVTELFKVTSSIRIASTQASESLRRGDDMDALATITNMTEVIRNFKHDCLFPIGFQCACHGRI